MEIVRAETIRGALLCAFKMCHPRSTVPTRIDNKLIKRKQQQMDERLIDTIKWIIFHNANGRTGMPYMTHNRTDIGSRRTRKKRNTKRKIQHHKNCLLFFLSKNRTQRDRERKQNVPGRAPNTHSSIRHRYSENPYS